MCARFRMMDSNEPIKPNVTAIFTFTSTSQSPYPIHHLEISSVGQIKELTKVIKFEMSTQKTTLAAVQLRFFKCHARGKLSKIIVVQASTGTATATGLRGV